MGRAYQEKYLLLFYDKFPNEPYFFKDTKLKIATYSKY